MKTGRLSLAIVAVVVAFTSGQAVAQSRTFSRCQAINAPGTWVLTQPITAVGTCITVEADFVTIDLSGFPVTGSGKGIGILAMGEGAGVGLTIRNGTIRGFADGVVVQADGLLIEGVRVTKNSMSAISVNGDNAAVRNSIVHDNGGLGIVIFGSNCLVVGNRVSGNGAGVMVAPTGYGQGCLISGNAVHGNGGIGIEAGRSTITGNVSTGNTGPVGEGIRALCPSSVTGNTATGNQHINLLLAGTGCVSAHNATE